MPKRPTAKDKLLDAALALIRERGFSAMTVDDLCKRAGVTNVFFNGAGWDQVWLDKIFPDTIRHPYKPDAFVNNSLELLDMVRKFFPG